jgi:hypothetical protein
MKTQIILSIGLMFLLNPLLSKRLEPKKVNSVLHNGKEYSINHSKIGTILVRDKDSKKEKIVTVYTIDYDPNLEKDVQDVFIKSILIYNNYLLIQNESDSIYKMDLETNEIMKIK